MHAKHWNFQGKQLKQLKQINIGIRERKSKTTFEKALMVKDICFIESYFGKWTIPSNALSSAMDLNFLNFDTFFLMISSQGEQLSIK
jgi:hypothetical protein